jgi:hypothetical protein
VPKGGEISDGKTRDLAFFSGEWHNSLWGNYLQSVVDVPVAEKSLLVAVMPGKEPAAIVVWPLSFPIVA